MRSEKSARARSLWKTSRVPEEWRRQRNRETRSILKVFRSVSLLPFSGRMGGKQDWRQGITEDAAATMKEAEDTAWRQVRKVLGSRTRQAPWDSEAKEEAGLPVHHQLPKLTQTHVRWVGDTIQPSHPLSSPCPAAPNPSQHQGLFQ